MKNKRLLAVALLIAVSGWGIALYQTSQASDKLVCTVGAGQVSRCYDPHPDPVPAPVAEPEEETPPLTEPTAPAVPPVDPTPDPEPGTCNGQ